MTQKTVLDLLDGIDGLPGDDLDAAPFHFRAQMLAHVVVEAAQDVLAAIDQRHLGAEPVEDAGELDRDIAAALDQDAFRQFLEMKRLVRRDDVLETRDLAAGMRRAAGGDQDILGAHRFAAREQAHGVGVLDHRAALDERDLGALQRGGIGGLEPRDLAILVGDQRRPIEDRLADGPAVAGRILELVGEARGIDQELLRDAAADHAGAADPDIPRRP